MNQNKRSNNFFELEPGTNDDYRFNRSAASRQDVRTYCAKLLEHHWAHCGDNHFQQDAVENPQQRWWEMYLSWVLFKESGFKSLPVAGEGPDLCAVFPDGRKVWVEAIAVKRGAGENEVHRPPPGIPGTLPVEKMVLRVTSGFSDKVKKIGQYIEKGIVKPDDGVIIAINTGEMRDSDLADQYPPLAVRALLGVGSAAFQVNVHLANPALNTDDVQVVFPEQTAIQKNEKTSIETIGLLANPRISGVITSTRHFVDLPSEGSDMKVLLNPKAQHKIDPAFFKFGTVLDVR